MKTYNTEQEFLADYDASAFDRPSVTADVLILSVSNNAAENWRRTDKKSFSVLLVRRDNWPQMGKWNLPGGFIGMDEASQAAAYRVLAQETGAMGDIYLEQLYTFDTPGRDPRTRVISIAYMALVDKNTLQYAGHRDARWFDIERGENGELHLRDGDTVLSADDLAFDHADIIRMGIDRLQNKIEYTDIVFDMMPPEFTLGELQQVYEIILNRKLIPAAFRRTIAARVEPTGNMRGGAGHRPSALFRRVGKK